MPPNSGIFCLLLAALICSTQARTWRQLIRDNYHVFNEFSITMLQNSVEDESNFVFSPFGYSTLLAVLAEGARGNTRNQLASILHLPEDTSAVRLHYKTILSNMKERGVLNKPEFKTWFYVYRNNTIRDTLKQVLTDNYLTEVKIIDRDDYVPEDKTQVEQSGSETTSQPDEVTTVPESETESPDQETVEDNTKDASSDLKDQASNDAPESSDKVQDNVKQTDSNDNHNLIKEEANDKEKEIINKGKEDVVKDKHKGDKTNKILEMMKGDLLGRALGRQLDKDTVTALSANRISNYAQKNLKETKSQMILFNGFYFRGNWSQPFQYYKEDDGQALFYVKKNETKKVKMMHVNGEFKIAYIADLRSTVIDIPYQGNRYSMMLILPKDKDGLAKVTDNLNWFPFTSIDHQLIKKKVAVCIPKFRFYTISRPKSALSKYGITDLFDESADLSGINGEKGLFIDDLVQLVTVHVDEGEGTANFISTTSILRNNDSDTFKADHPFLFFLRDNVDNLVITAGKVQDPSKDS